MTRTCDGTLSFAWSGSLPATRLTMAGTEHSSARSLSPSHDEVSNDNGVHVVSALINVVEPEVGGALEKAGSPWILRGRVERDVDAPEVVVEQVVRTVVFDGRDRVRIA